MARRKRGKVFTEAAGKTLKSIKYEENPDCQALELAFSDGTILAFEFSARVMVQSSYLRTRKGNLRVIRDFGRISGHSAHQP